MTNIKHDFFGGLTLIDGEPAIVIGFSDTKEARIINLGQENITLEIAKILTNHYEKLKP